MVTRKLAVLAATAVAALALAACGSSGSTASSSTSAAASSSAAESSAAGSSAGESSAAASSGAANAGSDELPAVDPAVLKDAVIGFAQVGSESGWRSANTDNIKTTAEKYGVDLQFTSAEQDQAKQISSIKTFITQGVDLIAFSPVVETGWDAVLQEADAAGIPVVLTDRSVDSDPSLYRTFIGSDFILEGEKAATWAQGEFADATEVNMVVLEGTTGSAPANDRATGWENILLCGLMFGLEFDQIKELTPSIGDFSGLGDFLDMPVRTYSTGMVMRLVFAIVTSVDAEILLMDEWLSVGDADFVVLAEQRLRELVDAASILVLASHDAAVIKKLCNVIVHLEHGEVVEVTRVAPE